MQVRGRHCDHGKYCHLIVDGSGFEGEGASVLSARPDSAEVTAARRGARAIVACLVQVRRGLRQISPLQEIWLYLPA